MEKNKCINRMTAEVEVATGVAGDIADVADLEAHPEADHAVVVETKVATTEMPPFAIDAAVTTIKVNAKRTMSTVEHVASADILENPHIADGDKVTVLVQVDIAVAIVVIMVMVVAVSMDEDAVVIAVTEAATSTMLKRYAQMTYLIGLMNVSFMMYSMLILLMSKMKTLLIVT